MKNYFIKKQFRNFFYRKSIHCILNSYQSNLHWSTQRHRVSWVSQPGWKTTSCGKKFSLLLTQVYSIKDEFEIIWKLHFLTIEHVIATISLASSNVMDLPTRSFWLMKQRVLLLNVRFENLNNKTFFANKYPRYRRIRITRLHRCSYPIQIMRWFILEVATALFVHTPIQSVVWDKLHNTAFSLINKSSRDLN